MSDNRLVFTLKLMAVDSAVGGSAQLPAIVESEANWLDNDSPDLLAPMAANNAGSQNTSVLDHLVTSGSSNLYSVSELLIQQNDQGFSLLTQKGRVQLQNGDIIKLGSQSLKAVIVKEHIVPLNPQQVPMVSRKAQSEPIDDIWAAPTQSSASFSPSSKYIDPFATTNHAPVTTGLSSYQKPVVKTNQNSYDNQDPLGFMYSNSQNARRPEPSVRNSSQNLLGAPYSAGMPMIADTLPSRGRQNDDGGLSVNSHQAYNRSSMSGPSNYREAAPAPSSQSLNPNQGNILKDLGIDSNTSLLAQRQVGTGKTTFDEQSPMDMLDEYLNDNMSAVRGRYVPPRPANGNGNGNNYPAMRPAARLAAPDYYSTPEVQEKPALFGKVSGFFKKLAS